MAVKLSAAFWVLVLVLIGVDYWWSTTSGSIASWWLALVAVNGACLVGIAYLSLRTRA